MGFPVSLTWWCDGSVVRCPWVCHRGAQKHKTAVFLPKSHFTWRKSATKFICV